MKAKSETFIEEFEILNNGPALSFLYPLAKKTYRKYPKICLSAIGFCLLAFFSMIYLFFSIPVETSRTLITRLFNSLSVKSDPRMSASFVWKHIPYITKRAGLFKNWIRMIVRTRKNNEYN